MADGLDGARLASLPLLAGVPAERLEPIAAMMSLHSSLPGEILGREGERGEVFWLVLEGQVRVTLAGHGLAEAGPGAILGELAVLRHRPRTATITATSPALLATGDEAVLHQLIEIAEFRQRVRLLASARLAHDLKPVRSSLKDGSPVWVRPLLPEDRAGFDEAVHSLSPDSLRRRFFTPAGPSAALIDFLIDIDYVDHFAWLAIDPRRARRGVATGRYVRTADPHEAEMAFGTVDDYQGHGIGTFLFGAVGVAAVEAGITRLVAHVLEDNLPMRSVFAKAHAKTRFDEPGVLMVEVEPEAAAALLDGPVRDQLAVSIHDVVTAATLALTPPS
jgi:RimJ/RimL family protein N-acetyltransferase